MCIMCVKCIKEFIYLQNKYVRCQITLIKVLKYRNKHSAQLKDLILLK